MQQQQQWQHEADSRTATLLLLDTPNAWLAKLLSGQYLDNDSKLNLFQTCKKLNEMVMQNSNSTSLKFDVVARPRDRMLNMLQTANRHAPSINLCLRRIVDHTTIQYDGMQFQMMPVVRSMLKVAAEQGATTAVTNITLEDATLETMLPPAIGQACPNLIKLSLNNCKIDLEGTISVKNLDRTIILKQHYPNLRALELLNCTLYEALYGQQQAKGTTHTDMQGPTALSSLTIATRSYPSFKVEVSIINSLAAPLTHLCVDTGYADRGQSVDQRLVDLNWVLLATTLQYLDLPGLYDGDRSIELLLGMPCLTHMRVQYFKLEKSYSGRPCNWQELVIERSVDAKILAYLPLHPGLVLKLGYKDDSSGGIFLGMDTGTCHFLPQAISNVKRAKALEWVQGCAKLSVSNMDASEFATCLTQALPLIKDVTDLEIPTYGGGLNKNAMQALIHFVSGRTDELEINVNSNQWVVGDMMALVAHMPYNSHIDFIFEDPDVEQHIIQLCCVARHKFSLTAMFEHWLPDRDAPQVCQQHTRSALQACGIDVLSLSTMHGYVLEITVQPHHDSLS